MSIERGPFADDYLWDRRGPVDPEVLRLERLLSPYALQQRSCLPSALPFHRRRRAPLLAVAAVLACAVLAGFGWYWQRLQWPAGQPWQLAVVAGQASIGGSALEDPVAVLPPEGVIRTGSDGIVRIEVARIGEIVLGNGSQMRLLQTTSGQHRVELEHGMLWARVWAPPYSFGVATPGGAAYDLGCEFLLRIDADGSGLLQVASGWVQFERNGVEVLVPEGAQTVLNAHGPPGTPHAIHASAAFASALRHIDAAGREASAAGSAVQQLLQQSRSQDAITLVSLLTRYPQLAAGPVFDHTIAILAPVDDIKRDAVRAGDPAAVDALWQALPYPRAKQWWLQWPDALTADQKPAALLPPVRR